MGSGASSVNQKGPKSTTKVTSPNPDDDTGQKADVPSTSAAEPHGAQEKEEIARGSDAVEDKEEEEKRLREEQAEKVKKRIEAKKKKVCDCIKNAEAFLKTGITRRCLYSTAQQLRNFVDQQSMDTELLQELKNSMDHLRKRNEEAARLEDEIKILVIKISKAASLIVKHNNPNIADLSDENRATKLSERLSEVYDNDWTDVFEVIRKYNKESDLPDRTIIEFLRDSLRFCFERCSAIVKDARLDLVRALLVAPSTGREENQGITNEATIGVPVHDYMIRTTPYVLPQVTQSVSIGLENEFGKEGGKKGLPSILKKKITKDLYRSYCHKCTEISWHCCLQSPPVVMDFEGKADKSVFRQYTQPGDDVDFVVWPVLRLHEDGPVLGKGVAQYMEKSDEENLGRV